MITEETVFILGAGANAPYKFPTGKGLRRQICTEYAKWLSQFLAFRLREQGFKQNLRRDPHTNELLEEAESFMQVFKDSSTQSIDLFLSRKPKYSTIGKQAIATCILRSEKFSPS